MMKYYIDTLAPELVAEAKYQMVDWQLKLDKRLGLNVQFYRPSSMTKLWEQAVFEVHKMPLPAEIRFSRDYGCDNSGIPHLPHAFYSRAQELNGLVRDEYMSLAAHKLEQFGIHRDTGIKIAESIFQDRKGSPVHIFM